MYSASPMIPEERAENIRTEDDRLADLQRYREGVEGLMNLGSSAPISNGMVEHAAILFEVFFRHEKSQVRIFCKNLNAAVFNSRPLIQAAREAVQSGKKIRIMVQDEPEPSDFFDFLKSSASNANVELLQAPEGFRSKPFNFATMDETAVRVEPDRANTKATASMNLPDVAKSWAEYFDKMSLGSSALLTS